MLILCVLLGRVEVFFDTLTEILVWILFLENVKMLWAHQQFLFFSSLSKFTFWVKFLQAGGLKHTQEVVKLLFTQSNPKNW